MSEEGNLLSTEEEEDYSSSSSYRHSWTIIQMVTAFFPSLVCLYAVFFLFSILLKSKLNSFNIYLFFIILPDAGLNFIYAVSLFWEGTHEGVYAPELCKARNAMGFFHYYGNLYLNAAVASEIHTLVQNSYRRIRTKPPPIRRVMLQVGAAYTLAAILMTWYILDVRWSPLAISDLVYCDTVFGSPTDDPVFTFWTGLLVMSVTLAPPIVYVFWVGYQIWSQKLLPVRGRTRVISIFFFRIVIVFLCFYVPSIVLALVYIGIPEDKQTARFWTLWAFTILIPVQCFVTLRLALTKDDIREALRACTRSILSGRSSTFFLSIAPGGSAWANSEWNTDDVYESSMTRTTTMSIEKSRNEQVSSSIVNVEEGEVAEESAEKKITNNDHIIESEEIDTTMSESLRSKRIDKAGQIESFSRE